MEPYTPKPMNKQNTINYNLFIYLNRLLCKLFGSAEGAEPYAIRVTALALCLSARDIISLV